jgi:hypothetical protein
VDDVKTKEKARVAALTSLGAEEGGEGMKGGERPFEVLWGRKCLRKKHLRNNDGYHRQREARVFFLRKAPEETAGV